LSFIRGGEFRIFRGGSKNPADPSKDRVLTKIGTGVRGVAMRRGKSPKRRNRVRIPRERGLTHILTGGSKAVPERNFYSRSDGSWKAVTTGGEGGGRFL